MASRDRYEETRAIQYIMNFNPSNVIENKLMYTDELINYKEKCKSNKYIVYSIEALLKLKSIYENSFLKLGPSQYTNLAKSGLQNEYNKTEAAYYVHLSKAKKVSI